MRFLRLVLIGALSLFSTSWAQAKTLKVGDRAPQFSLPDQEGNPIQLSGFYGKKNVVLAFYVLAFTGG